MTRRIDFRGVITAFVILWVTVLSSVAVAGAAEIILEAEADALIRTDLDVRRNDNYGQDDILIVGTSRGGGGIPEGGADAMRSLIRFDLSGVPDEPLGSAFLELTIHGFDHGSATSVYTVDVHNIVDSGPRTPWEEGNGFEDPCGAPGAVDPNAAFGVAWDGVDANNTTQPDFDPTVAASATIDQGVHGTGDVICWDITSLVRDWLNGTVPNFGIMLRDVTTDGLFRGVQFGSREGELLSFPCVAARGPRLVLTPCERVIYVDDDAEPGGDGTWEHPYRYIQDGIDAATHGDCVLVLTPEDGEYTGPRNRDLDFCGKAITVGSESGAETCIINCEGSKEEPHRGFHFYSSEGPDSVVCGFTIRNGWADQGGGICCENSSPTIKNNIITDNRANLDGGGICCDHADSREMVITSNIIKGNRVLPSPTGGGGGICYYYCANLTITDNVISGNFAESTSYGGGGIFGRWGGAGPTITNNIIKDNKANGGECGGGGICCWNSSPTITNNVISHNCALGSYYGGGGICCVYCSNTAITNNTITHNSAESSSLPGGAIVCSHYSTATIINTILWNNRPLEGKEIILHHYSSVTVRHSDVRGGWGEPDDHNIDEDPLFICPDDGNYHLSDCSPCIGEGTETPEVPGTDKDKDGKPRPDPPGSNPDMGAYENSLGAPKGTDVTAMSQIDKFGTRFDRRTGEFSMMATWKNIGADPLLPPLRMVIENITPDTVTCANSDGTTEDGKPYYGYCDLVGDGKLDPGETSEAKQLIFNNPSRVRFEFDVSCWACVESGGSPAPPNQPFIAGTQRMHIVIPGVSALAQNYPNPFNPETWIPYELAEPGDVRISIYDIQGRLVRTVDLGHREIGQYFAKDEAAYWDGRNDFGEETVSGVYFYQIQAGDFHAVRKMVIAR